MPSPFIHLHLHSEYSLVDSTLRVRQIVDAAVANQMPAVAITDLSNVFSVVKFYKTATQAGIKPIIGSDVWLEREDQPGKPFRLVLLCQDEQGYRNLTALLSEAYRSGQHVGGHACVSKAGLKQKNAGLIALSAAREGELGNALLHGSATQVELVADEYLAMFGDRFYIELQRTGRVGDEEHIDKAMTLAARRSMPIVASNDARFLAREDFEVHDIRVCIHDSRILTDPRRPRLYTDQQYFRSSQQMSELFVDIPEAIENSYHIAMRCNCRLTLGENFMPEFPVEKGQDVDQLLIDESRAGLQNILDAHQIDDSEGIYAKRLQFEIDVIIKMGFPGYFLIVADFIRWAKEHDIPVGPGRGSGAGSLVAYAIGITEIDPIEHDLLFERFLNPERVSMPDFDIDFCMDQRDRVIDYVTRRYGSDKVSQIITYGTMAAGPCPGGAGQCVLDSAGNPAGAANFDIESIQNNWALSAKLSVPISDYVLRLGASHAAAQNNARAARISRRAARLKVASDAQITFYNWVRGIGQEAVAKNSLQRTRARLKDAEAALPHGVVTRADVLRLKALVAGTEAAIAQAKAFRALAAEQIAVWMNEKSRNYQLGEDVLATPAPGVRKENLQALFREGKRRRLELKVLSANRIALRKGATAVRAARYPRLDGFADLVYANPNQRAFPPRREWSTTWSAGLALTWTVNDTFVHNASAAELDANARQLDAQMHTLENGIRVEISAAYVEQAKARAALSAAQRSAEAAQAAYKVAVDLYQMGKATTTEVIEAESELVGALLQRINAHLDLRWLGSNSATRLAETCRVNGGAIARRAYSVRLMT